MKMKKALEQGGKTQRKLWWVCATTGYSFVLPVACGFNWNVYWARIDCLFPVNKIYDFVVVTLPSLYYLYFANFKERKKSASAKKPKETKGENKGKFHQ